MPAAFTWCSNVGDRSTDCNKRSCDLLFCSHVIFLWGEGCYILQHVSLMWPIWTLQALPLPILMRLKIVTIWCVEALVLPPQEGISVIRSRKPWVQFCAFHPYLWTLLLFVFHLQPLFPRVSSVTSRCYEFSKTIVNIKLNLNSFEVDKNK